VIGSRDSLKKPSKMQVNFAHRGEVTYNWSIAYASNLAVPSSRVDKVLTEDIVILELHLTILPNWSGDKKAFKEGAGEMADVTSKVRQTASRLPQCFKLRKRESSNRMYR
jgi:hypothetical protein